MARRHIVVHDETWDELYAIKGPRRSFEDAIKELIDTVYPRRGEDEKQKSLFIECPNCGEILEHGCCPGCGYPEEDE